MNRHQIENLYKANGLTDYQLKSTEDLLKTHGIDYKAVDGYSRLDELNQTLYKKFIVNKFNACGLEYRATIIPKGIYFVEDTEYIAKERPEDDYYVVVGGLVKAIDRNGMMSVHRQWTDENYQNIGPVESETKRYLRFEYEHHDGIPTWLHVISETEWY